eukprot:TRINITY_DN3958_c0_g1_i1.p1 TRINITY_DN3958_c0_g1~~TRINITY_DN3958_c0_g1_i1.p1  ORF type:complete len:587 (-),score=57.24 TRINITY_DN3958_c0_g1_i1:104-1714(-)
MTAPKPHIVLVVVDDLGYNDVSYRGQSGGGPTPPDTPQFTELIAEGIQLNRAYSYAWCAPARASLLSGRMPVHVNVNETDSLAFNPQDPVSGSSGIPSKMTVISAKLKQAGYRTHYTGKWGVGFAWDGQMPISRGFDSFLGYLHDSCDYYTSTLSKESVVVPTGCEKGGIDGIVDLTKNSGPAYGLNGTMWLDYLFMNESIQLIDKHDTRDPLFLVHAFHSVHTPLNPPDELLKPYKHLMDPTHRAYHAMTAFVDTSVGKLVTRLKQKHMWENTLLVVSSDNGGPIYAGKSLRMFGGASNYPLRGGKTSDFEGGIRVNQFVSGGLIPKSMRGKTLDDYIHMADWYGTFCALANVSLHDSLAEEHGLPPVDSVNQWPLLSGQISVGHGMRSEMHISPVTLIQGRWKLLTGSDPGSINSNQHEGVVPFNSYGVGYGLSALKTTAGLLIPPYGLPCHSGCLFDILGDPTESRDVAAENPNVVSTMLARLRELNGHIFNPNRGKPRLDVCNDMQRTGYYQPFAHENMTGIPSEFVHSVLV